MVLKIAHATLTSILPSKYYTHAVLVIVAIITIHAYAQGRKTNRERDLHGRSIIVTGAFTPIGLTLLDSLARRGAHLIALSPDPVDLSEGAPATSAALLVPVLRSTTNNENIYAEHCDLTSPASIRAFCAHFVQGEQQRLDAILFAHEYAHIGPMLPTKPTRDVVKERRDASCATFLLTTLLLPVLLVAPVERDIRLVTLINPFYAAAAATFSALPTPGTASTSTYPQSALFLTEGRRALRTAIMTRHLQRVLDALPASAQVPRANSDASTVPVVSDKVQRSNIVTVSVSPGVSRSDIIAPLLGADTPRQGVSISGIILYFLATPILRMLTKSSASAAQGVLHTLFLPTPFKRLATSSTPGATAQFLDPEEVLKPGALYAECAVTRLHVPLPPAPPENDSESDASSQTSNAAGASDNPGTMRQTVDDGELGGEVLGTLVWDEYERELKAWEALEIEEQRRAKQGDQKRGGLEDGRHTPPTVDETSG
ncbi:hypothetical protein HETIRDRAFT_447059 [Heterobasidion irregulare TC 32-1]|uniref:Ketoreductase (KR) domain-containing protein n=1 Tax=Heterobasidion irregulare (strain TC 32-1) TaxID=747525 RepID=W4JMC3_HETIT|nr:uncharacterized protein HETIRDRAFT_447059 [Heterobasidion irregulare TC 32-1]ETW74702.1 hypothetical protein HETIRDRAFT_447059 [Heterobasidion irregulare TC 32-1]